MRNTNAMALIVAYYLSKFDTVGLAELGYTSWNQADGDIAQTLAINQSLVKNMRDQFDAVHDNKTTGWQQRPLTPSLQRVIEVLSGMPEPDTKELVRAILFSKDPETSTKVFDLIGNITEDDIAVTSNKSLQDLADKSEIIKRCGGDSNRDYLISSNSQARFSFSRGQWEEREATHNDFFLFIACHAGTTSERVYRIPSKAVAEQVILRVGWQDGKNIYVYAHGTSDDLTFMSNKNLERRQPPTENHSVTLDGARYRVDTQNGIVAARVRGSATKAHLKLEATSPTVSSEVHDAFDFNFNRIENVIESSGLFFRKTDLYVYHLNLTCLPDKHFVILSGISGTGKSELARAYANAVYHADPHLKGKPYFLRIEVEADWQSMRPLLGFFNHLTGHYERKPFLDLMIEADLRARQAEIAGKTPPPFFVCLDEMNIARVEYYFSRLLSAMESGDAIHIHNGEADNDGVPRAIHYPKNLFLTATINADESTFAVSDKVLDRAFTMDLSTVLLGKYQEWLKMRPDYKDDSAVIDRVFTHLGPVQDVLAAKRFHMGYRTIKEIIALVVRSQAEQGLLTPEQALDLALAEKGLPKLRGDERLIKTLERLITELGKLGSESHCLSRVKEMKEEISEYGLSQFGR